jgi:hypothetical protein
VIISVCAFACVAFVIKHNMCQPKHKLHWDFGFSGCKLKRCCLMLEGCKARLWPNMSKAGAKLLVPVLSENEAKNY